MHENVIKWKHYRRYWPFVREIRGSPVNSPNKGQWRGALMFSFICAWTNGWVSNRDAGDLRRHSAYVDVTVMALIKQHRTYSVANMVLTVFISVWRSHILNGFDVQAGNDYQISKNSNAMLVAKVGHHFHSKSHEDFLKTPRPTMNNI